METHAHHDHHAQATPESAAQEAMHAEHGHMEHGGHAEHGGHGMHAGHIAIFRRRFWISLILALPVVFFSEMIQEWLRYDAPSFTGSGWIAPVLGTVIFLYGGEVFLRGGWDELRERKPGMMTLISLAILVAFVASAATTLDLFDLEFWWELALLIVVMLLGHWLEMRAVGEAQGALGALAALLPDEAERVAGDSVETVPLSELQTGDVVLARPGARVPADGEIVDGA
ncbi:MAG: heavy metal translocating P-type ATPase, partial [Thermomicrobiales bacterium]